MVKRRKMAKKRIKQITLILLGLGLLYSCDSKPKEINETEKVELIASASLFLTQWHQAAAGANYENYFGKMDSLSIFIGTDYTENWQKKDFEAFSKPYFERGKAWSFSAIDRNIYTSSSGEIIWFDELLETWMGVCRGSGVLQNKNGELTLKHYVLSVTVPNDSVNAFLKLKPQELDSVFVRNLKFK